MDGSPYQDSSNEAFSSMSESIANKVDVLPMEEKLMGLVCLGISSVIELPKTPLPFDLGYLTPELKKEAKESLNETEEAKKEGIEYLKLLIAGEKGLICPKRDNFYLQFLRARKFNLHKSFKLLKNYYTFKKKHNEIYDNIDIEADKILFSRNCLCFLPYRDNYGSVVVIAKFENWDVDISPFEQVFRGVSACLCLSIEDPATQVAGYRAILDLRGFTMKHLQMATPRNIMLLIHSTQYCFPGRYKGIHILSNNKLFNIVWNICLPFLTFKLKNRIFLHDDSNEGLSKFIDPSILPEEFGGFGPPLDGSFTIEMGLERLDIVNELLQYGYKTQK